MGYLIEGNLADDVKVEYDTVSCVHCQAIVRIIKRKREKGGFCRRCMGPLCVSCAQKKACTPFLRQVEEQLTRQARRRALPL